MASKMKCHCGGTVEEKNLVGKKYNYRGLRDVVIRVDVYAPNCNDCNETFLGAETAKNLDAALEKSISIEMGPEKSLKAIEEAEIAAIEKAIILHKGNLTEACKVLGIGRATLYRKVKQYHIDPASARKKKIVANNE